jgi:hypothetical protein
MPEFEIRPITRADASDLAMECLLDLIRRGALKARRPLAVAKTAHFVHRSKGRRSSWSNSPKPGNGKPHARAALRTHLKA